MIRVIRATNLLQRTVEYFACFTDRVSVPMWGTFLSEPLLIVALVGRYPANKLIRRIPILYR